MKTGAALLGLSAVLLAAGCAGVPGSGAVVVERTLAPGVAAQPIGGIVREAAAPPLRGEGPVALVEGFLSAEADSSNGYLQARRFLAPGASWNPAAGVRVYSAGGLRVRRTGPRAVTVSAPALGRLDAADVYLPENGRQRDVYRLVLVAGQWRLAGVPGGLDITGSDLQYNDVTGDVYYFADGGRALVPEPVFLPGNQLALPTELMEALLAGPDRWLSRALTTALPAGATLSGSAVRLGSSVTVDLDVSPDAVSPRAAEGILEQVAATMGGLAGVSSVQVTAQGQPLVLPSGPASAVPTSYGANLRVDSVRAWPVATGPVPPGTTARAVTPQGGAAIVFRGRAYRAADAGWALVDRVRSVASVAFGAGGVLWIGASQGLYRVGPGASSAVWFARGGPVTAVAAAPDGVRLALATPAGVELGIVGRSGLLARRLLAPGLRGAKALAWAGPDTLEVLGPDGGLFQVSAGGAATVGVSYRPPVPGVATTMTAGVGRPVMIAVRGRLWAEVNQAWVPSGAGVLPAYPGG